MSLNTLLLGLIATIAVSYVSTRYLVLWLGRRQFLDLPNDRSSHTTPTPRGGGLIIVALGVLQCVLLAISGSYTTLMLTFAGLWMLWGALGWLDDAYQLGARSRFLVQFLLAGVTVLLFGYADVLHISLTSTIVLGGLGVVLSVVGIVWMVNLYNFMDGIDGLAASQAIVACITLAFWFFLRGGNDLALLCLGVAASTYGFLLLNWQPAKLFMGDVGSLSLGFFFAVMLVIGNNRFDIPIFCSITLLMVFVADTMSTLVTRAKRREALGQAHRDHHYQKLVDFGLQHKTVVSLYLSVMVLFSMISTVMLIERNFLLPGFIFACVFSLVLSWLVKRVVKTSKP